jgi:hypothetical protein
VVEGAGGSPRRHDVFLSYSHGADGRLAPAVQRALERLGARWPQTRALRVFRDTTGLSADASLWGAIESALDGSEWFLLLASPDAAESTWVQRELEHWLSRNPPGQLLVVLTEGEWHWDRESGDLRGSSVPPVLHGRFTDEPRHVDLRWARSEVDLDLHHARFRDAIAELAAPVHHVAKDDLEGEHVRERRRVRRLTRAAIAALTCLTLIATALAALAWRQTSQARDQAERASAQALAVRSQQLVGTRPDLAGLYAAESVRLFDQPAGRAALIESINADPLLERVTAIDEPEVPIVLSRDGALVVTQRPEGLAVRRAESGALVRRIELSDNRSLPTTTERPAPLTIPARAPTSPAAGNTGDTTAGGSSPGLRPTAIGFGLWPLVAVDRVSDRIAVAGANGDPAAVSVWPLEASEDVPGPATEIAVGDDVTELAWLTDTALLAIVTTTAPPPGVGEIVSDVLSPAGFRLIDTTTGEVRGVQDGYPYLHGGQPHALSESRASGRFLAWRSDAVVVMDAAGQAVRAFPALGDYQLTPDGQRVLHIDDPYDRAVPTGMGLPAIELLDIATGAVLWSLRPDAYVQRYEGLEFGNAVTREVSHRLPMSADGSRILVDSWMIGPAAGQDLVRLDPIGLDSPAWPTGSAPRSVALSSEGTHLTRILPSGVAHVNTAVEVECSRLARITPLIPLRPEGGSVRPACSWSPALPPIRLETADFATVSRDGRHVAMLGIGTERDLFSPPDRPNEPLLWRLTILDRDTGSVSEADVPTDWDPGSVDLQLTFDDYVLVLLAGSDVSEAFWYSPADGSLRAQRTFRGPAGVDPDNNRLLAVDGRDLVEVDLDDPDSSTVLQTWSRDIGEIRVVDGFVLLSDSPYSELISWTVLTPDGDREVIDLAAGEVLAAASPDAASIAIRSERSVTVLDSASGRTKVRINGSGPDSVEFVGDGLVIEFARSVEYHDLTTGATSVLARIDPLRDQGIEQMAADGDRVVTFSGDGMRIYVVAGDLESIACKRAGRPLTPNEWRAAAAVGSPTACT